MTISVANSKDIGWYSLLRWLFWIASLSLIFWAFSTPQLQDIEGFLKTEFCLLLTTGVAGLILGWAIPGRLRQFSFWFALAMVGQAVALQLIEAGTVVRYQHYKPLNHLLSETSPILLIYLVIQMTLVGVGLKARWPQIRDNLNNLFCWRQRLGIGLILFVFSATVSREISLYLTELAFAALILTINLGNIVLIFYALPEKTLSQFKQTVDIIFGTSETTNHRSNISIDRFALIGAIWVFTLASIFSLFSYEKHPHIVDEVIYLYHARYLAAGALTVAAPPAPEAFSFYLIPDKAAQWYSIFPPGWPALLAVGVLAKVPWLLNPILAGVNILLAYLFLGELYDRRTARLVVLLLCVSPWFVFMGMNFMAHTFTMTCFLLALLGISWSRRTGQVRWSWLAGGAIGVISLIRPLDGGIVAILLGCWAIGLGGKRLRFPALVAFGLSILLVGSIVFPYNQAITGSSTTFPLMDYYEQYFGHKSNALGFGPERGLGWALDPYPGHSLIDALINANLNIFSINIELFGWSIGSLLFVAILIFNRQLQKQDYLMLTPIIIVPSMYSLYWFSGGPDFGARYWYLVLLPLIILTVRGMQVLSQKLASDINLSHYYDVRVLVLVITLSSFALINHFPWRAINKYHHYRGMQPGVEALAEEYNFGRSLVLIQGNSDDYQSAWIFNSLDINADTPLYAWDQNPAVRQQVIEEFLDRPVWLVDGPSITNENFRVVAGPLLADELLRSEQLINLD